MKKTISGLFVIAAAMAACNKTKPMTPSSTANSSATESAPIVAARPIDGGPKAYIVHMNVAGSGKGWCGGFAANCISLEPDVVISGAMKTAMDGAVSSGSAATVETTFSAPAFNNLNTNYLGADQANKLKSGSYYLGTSNDNGTTVCYIAGTTYPVTLENMDFAFQGRY